jgi:hypothetical protein
MGYSHVPGTDNPGSDLIHEFFSPAFQPLEQDKLIEDKIQQAAAEAQSNRPRQRRPQSLKKAGIIPASLVTLPPFTIIRRMLGYTAIEQ